MKILGLDPGTATTGFGLIQSDPKHKQGFRILEYGVIETDKSLTDAERLVILFDDISGLLKKYQPDRVGIEKLFFSTNQKTGITVAQARGVVLLACQQERIPLAEFTPLQVKNRLCGYGQATKQQMQYMVKQSFGLTTIPKPDDAADALAIALCAALTRL
jgi:crossover junction endodeoxyribonuclease RuvC